MEVKPLQNLGSGTKNPDLETILYDRGRKYGKFSRHAQISQALKNEIFRWQANLIDDQREALEMIAHKIARILNGDPNWADSWRDIAGYAQLVANRLEER